jgi:hypothetical protein
MKPHDDMTTIRSALRSARWIRGAIVLASIVLGVVPAMARPVSQQPTRERVHAAAMVTYIHGMTAEIARDEFGEEAVPVLLDLLADPEFTRRDNVVAVLG